MRSVVQKRQALAALQHKGSPLVGCKDEKILELLVRVVSIKLLAHGASFFIQLRSEALAEDVVGLVPLVPGIERCASFAEDVAVVI